MNQQASNGPAARSCRQGLELKGARFGARWAAFAAACWLGVSSAEPARAHGPSEPPRGASGQACRAQSAAEGRAGWARAGGGGRKGRESARGGRKHRRLQKRRGGGRQELRQRQASEPPASSEFQKVTLNGAPGEPIGLAVLPDGRVLHTTRAGRVWLHSPATGFNTVAADIPVYSHDEEGLQGIAVDPDFEKNGWVYLYYSPQLGTPQDDATTPAFNEGDSPAFGSAAEFAPFRGHMQLSRFRLRGDRLDLSSEQRILQVESDRGVCCHVGGDIDFDAAGNLYLSTGDDTNPFEADGFAPLDARSGRNPAFDARRTSGNTNDLRGKLLRIRVRKDGSYTIPRGNLFSRRKRKTRPEIYAMGLRNPFRIAVNRRSGDVYVADYSPDSLVAEPERGPAGQGKWAVVRGPGNYGWPFCATAELAYVRYDFETQASGEPYDCARLRNDSPHNTGRRRLPPVVQPEVWYGGAESERFPELGFGGVGPMAGPAYEFDRRVRSDRRWPRYYDGVPLFYEWARDAVFTFALPAGARRRGARPGSAPAIERLLPEVVFDNAIDMEFGPDGALYVLEYGDGYFGENEEAQLSRVDHLKGNASPVASALASVQFGLAPLSVQLSAAGSFDPDGDAIEVFWDFDSDGTVDSTELEPVAVFESNGRKAATLRVVDAQGRSSTAAARVVVGNAPPVLTFVSPTFGQPFSFGQTLSYEVSVADDTPVDCSRVQVEYVLGHDQHGHPLSVANGCTGQFSTVLDEGHVGAANIGAVLIATYTDLPEDPEIPALSGREVVVLLPTAEPAAASSQPAGGEAVGAAEEATEGEQGGALEAEPPHDEGSADTEHEHDEPHDEAEGEGSADAEHEHDEGDPSGTAR